MFIRRTHSNNIGILQPITENYDEKYLKLIFFIGIGSRILFILKNVHNSKSLRIKYMSDMGDIIYIYEPGLFLIRFYFYIRSCWKVEVAKMSESIILKAYVIVSCSTYRFFF